MKSGFKDPAAIKKQHPMDKPRDGNNTPWESPQPQYDQRSSCFVNVGTHYGVGINQPIGHEGNPKSKVPVLPHGVVNAMEVDEVG
jgi:hypothetical protein